MANFNYDQHFTKMMNVLQKNLDAIKKNYTGTININFSTSGKSVVNNCSFSGVAPKKGD